MPTLFRRENGVYYIVYSIDGKRKWKSTLSTEKHLAIKALMNFNKLLSHSGKRILLSRFIEDFLTLQRRTIHVARSASINNH